MIQVRWTGAAGLEFSGEDATVLIDPYFSRPGMRKIFLGRLAADCAAVKKHIRAMKPIKAVVVRHTHFDHALDVSAVAARCSAAGAG